MKQVVEGIGQNDAHVKTVVESEVGQLREEVNQARQESATLATLVHESRRGPRT